MMSTAKDFHRCLRNLHRFTDGQVTVVDWNIDTISKVVIDVCPNSGLYEGGQFRFQILVENEEPHVTCQTNIYHPNIDPTDWNDNVCVSILDEWEPSYGLQDCVQGILFLLHNPNLSDPLSPYFDAYYDEDEFAENVRRSLRGEEVEGVTFDRRQDTTATITTTTIERQAEDTFGLKNFFADNKQEDTIVVDNVFADRKQEDTVGVENAFADQNQEDTVGVENIFVDRKQKTTVGQEDVFANQKREDTVDLQNIFANEETVVGGAIVDQVHHTVEGKPLAEGCSDQIAVHFSRMILPHEKGARLILVCKHSCHTVIPVLRKLLKLLNAAATSVRYSFSRIRPFTAEKSTCYECIA